MFDLIEARAVETPDRPALWFAGTQFSYLDLERRARRLARRLHGLGVGFGDRVSIVAPNHVAHFDLLLAAPKLGFVFAPLNPRLGHEELERQIERVKPALLLFDVAHARVDDEARATATEMVCVPLVEYERWLVDAPDAPIAPQRDLTPEDLHMILFTSGSTGAPKGARIPYRQTLGNAEDTVAVWGVRNDDCVIQCTPCFHAAFNALSLPLLMAGGRIVLMQRFEPGEYLTLAQAHGVTLLFMVPTMYRALSDDPAFFATPLSSVRWAVTGGAPCPPALHQALARHGIVLRQGFGMTEAGTNCFDMGMDEDRCGPESVGRPLPRVRAALRNADGSLAAVGTVGELTLAGPQVCSGYYEPNPMANEHDGDLSTAAQMFRDGWLWTGDLARCDEHGIFTICGRRKDIYISGGENVYPAEIEAALARCEAVAESSVFGWPHDKWGECGVAVVALHPGAVADSESLRSELRRYLAGYKVPADIQFVAAIPKNGVGKIVKADVRTLYGTALAARDAASVSA